MTSRIQYNNPKSSEALGLPYHYEMVSDKKRVTPFKKAIFATCKGKRVLESGTGSAILSILAAKAGAQKVYAVEIDEEVARFAKENIKRARYQNVITLIESDVLKVKLKDIDNEKVDAVIAENLSTWQVTEPQIQIMNHINNFLAKKNSVVLPAKIFNYIELAQSQYRFENVIDLRTHYFEFTGIRKSKILSTKKLFEEIDLTKQNSPNVTKKIRIKINSDGVLNSVRLTSPLQVHGRIAIDYSDSLMPPVVFPIEQDIQVSKNDIVELSISYKHNTKWEAFNCEAKKI